MSGLTPEIRREILHRTCARLLSGRCFGPLVVWEAVCDVADGFDLGERVRHYRGQLRGFVEVYLSLFLPDGSWSFEAAGDPPVLWWSGDRGVFCDFFFVGDRDSNPWSLTVRPSVRRLVVAGRERFGRRFLGVRVLVPAAPGRSLLVVDRKAPPVRLADSDLWFGSMSTALADLVAAGGGDVS